MAKIIHYIQKSATGKKVLGFLIPAMTIYFFMLFYTIPQVMQYARGMKIFDLSPTGYSYNYAMELLDALGSKGRETYLYSQLPLDFLYPGLFGVSCCLLLAWLFAKSLNNNSKMYFLCLIPVTGGFFDYLENISVFMLLTSYPDIGRLNVSLASIFTILKSVLTTVFFVLLATGFILALVKNKKETPRKR